MPLCLSFYIDPHQCSVGTTESDVPIFTGKALVATSQVSNALAESSIDWNAIAAQEGDGTLDSVNATYDSSNVTSPDTIEICVYFNGLQVDSKQVEITAGNYLHFNASDTYIANDVVSVEFNFSIPATFWTKSPLSISLVARTTGCNTNDYVYFYDLAITDTTASRTDAHSWNLMSELPSSGTLNSQTYNNLQGASGCYPVYDEATSSFVNATSITVVQPTRPSANMTTLTLVNHDGTTTRCRAIRAYQDNIDATPDDNGDTGFTNITFSKILNPALQRNITSTEFPSSSLLPNEKLFEGLQFNGTTVDNSIRRAYFVANSTKTIYGIYMKPCLIPGTIYIDPARLELSNLFVPFNAAIMGDVALPYMPSTQLGAGESITGNITLESMLNPHVQASWTFTFSKDTRAQVLSIDIDARTDPKLAGLAGQFVQVIMSVSCVGSSAIVSLAHLYWVNMTLSGHTDIVQLSSGMPDYVRARFFSNTFIWFYTNNPIKNLGIPKHQDTHDMFVTVSGNITKILNVEDAIDHPLPPLPDWAQTQASFHETDGSGSGISGIKKTGNLQTFMDYQGNASALT